MNNRSLTRGDAGVIGAAVLLFIASFLDLYDTGRVGSSFNGWSSDFFPVLPSIFLAGIIGAGLIVGSRFLPQPDREFAGLKLAQWGTALSVTSFWAAFWTMTGGPDGIDKGVGFVLAFIATLILAALAIAAPMVPALQAPLIPAGGPKAPPSAYGQPQAYGAQPGQPQPGQPQAGYGYPGPGAQQPPYGSQPGVSAVQQPAAADPNFQPFWFAVPAARPLYDENGAPNPVAELAPGTWYLAVEQRGQALVAQTQDGRRGVLQDTSGIQRG
ncbi:DUF5336 domain-containing protein [Streptomyces xiamenensis]|uniref:DUF5336 domain-containing protein n=1 Tax=Streptomyces xiamenensis TaxID=408015 RepID=UPI0034182622